MPSQCWSNFATQWNTTWKHDLSKANRGHDPIQKCYLKQDWTPNKCARKILGSYVKRHFPPVETDQASWLCLIYPLLQLWMVKANCGLPSAVMCLSLVIRSKTELFIKVRPAFKTRLIFIQKFWPFFNPVTWSVSQEETKVKAVGWGSTLCLGPTHYHAGTLDT